jgi:hypothetical protein
MNPAGPRTPARHRPVGWLILALLVGGCARDDLSSYLRSGRCDDQSLCADGYECDRSTWQCVRTGTIGDAGQGAEAPDVHPEVADLPSDLPISSPDAKTSPLDTAPDALLDTAPDAPPEATPDSPPEAALTCDGGQTPCGDQCFDLETSSTHCGSCGATCTSGAVNLACGTFVAGTCDCAGDDARCGLPGQGTCEPTTGLCVCSGGVCARGEICTVAASGAVACSCDGAVACRQGLTCCVGQGCADLSASAEHCGACGRACPKQFYCQDGTCRCRSDKVCQVGADGTCTSAGHCECGGVLCALGLRCLAPGVCG